MKKAAVSVVLLAFLAAISTYFLLYTKNVEYRFTEPQIRDQLSQKLPLEKTYLFIFSVILDNPRVTLINGSNRVNAGMDVVLNIKFGSEPLPLGGTIDVSGGLRYSRKESAFYLEEPIIENLGIQGVPEKYSEKVKQVMELALAEYFSKRPIYTLKADDPAKSVAKILLKDVVVENQELVVTLGL